MQFELCYSDSIFYYVILELHVVLRRTILNIFVCGIHLFQSNLIPTVFVSHSDYLQKQYQIMYNYFEHLFKVFIKKCVHIKKQFGPQKH